VEGHEQVIDPGMGVQTELSQYKELVGEIVMHNRTISKEAIELSERIERVSGAAQSAIKTSDELLKQVKRLERKLHKAEAAQSKSD